MLSDPSNTLEIFSIYCTNLSARAANIMLTALVHDNMLKILSIEGNDITDDSCPCIANVVKLSSCLVELWICFNPISAEAISPILEALQFNDTLETFGLPNYPYNIQQNIKSLEDSINKTRESHKSYNKLIIDFSTTTYCL